MEQIVSLKRPRKATEKDSYKELPKKGGYRPKGSGSVGIAAEPSLLPSVAMSEHDKASQITLDKDQLVVYGAVGGYRMARATHGVHKGSYYWEIEVLQPEDNEEGHVRVGWSTRQGELQAPVGFDKHSYAYRDVGGSRIHKCERYDNYGASFGVGDVIGCYISLQDDPSQNKMCFYKNGVNQGVAYSGTDIPPGVYFPAVSLYMKSVVRVNFGPSFIVKHDIHGANAVSELQPMSPEDRKVHEQNINAIKESRAAAKSAGESVQ